MAFGHADVGVAPWCRFVFNNYPGEWEKRRGGKYAWNYLLFFTYLAEKDSEEFNGLENFVTEQVPIHTIQRCSARAGAPLVHQYAQKRLANRQPDAADAPACAQRARRVVARQLKEDKIDFLPINTFIAQQRSEVSRGWEDKSGESALTSMRQQVAKIEGDVDDVRDLLNKIVSLLRWNLGASRTDLGDHAPSPWDHVLGNAAAQRHL